jgi:hypothetical protein
LFLGLLVVGLGLGCVGCTSGVDDSYVDAGAGSATVAPADGGAASTPATPTIEGVSFASGWTQVAGESWVGSVLDIAALPAGGFVAAWLDPGVGQATDRAGVRWSADGIRWRDADPQGVVELSEPAADSGPPRQILTATTERVVVLDVARARVWVGDLANHTWRPVDLGTPWDSDTGIDLLAVTANETQVLVVGQTLAGPAVVTDPPPEALRVGVAWVIDPVAGTAVRHQLPTATFAPGSDGGVLAEWYADQWVLLMPDNLQPRPTPGVLVMLTSPDGAAWTMAELPGSMPSRWVTSLTAGPGGLLATMCGFGDDAFWLTEDARTWAQVDIALGAHESAYADGIGYIAMYKADMSLSADGKTWEPAGQAPIQGSAEGADLSFRLAESLVASGDTLLVHNGNLWVWTQPDASVPK